MGLPRVRVCGCWQACLSWPLLVCAVACVGARGRGVWTGCCLAWEGVGWGVGGGGGGRMCKRYGVRRVGGRALRHASAESACAADPPARPHARRAAGGASARRGWWRRGWAAARRGWVRSPSAWSLPHGRILQVPSAPISPPSAPVPPQTPPAGNSAALGEPLALDPDRCCRPSQHPFPHPLGPPLRAGLVLIPAPTPCAQKRNSRPSSLGRGTRSARVPLTTLHLCSSHFCCNHRHHHHHTAQPRCP